MLDRLRNSAFGRRLAAAGSRFFDAFIRDNRVIPPVLALLALATFAWVVAGLFVGIPDERPASNREDLVQAEDPVPQDPPAPETEVRNVDSYAAYQNKDPFRELLAPAEATNGEESTAPEEPAVEPDDSTTTRDDLADDDRRPPRDPGRDDRGPGRFPDGAEVPRRGDDGRDLRDTGGDGRGGPGGERRRGGLPDSGGGF